MWFIYNNGLRFCTRRDMVGVNEDVKKTVIRHNSVGVKEKRFYLLKIHQVLHD